MMNMTSVCTYEKISVDKIMEQVEIYMKDINVNYKEKTQAFEKMGQEALDKIIKELED